MSSIKFQTKILLAGVSAVVLVAGCKPSAKLMAGKEAYIIGGKDQIQHAMPDKSDADTADSKAESQVPSQDILARLIKASVLLATPMISGEVRFCSGAIYNTDQEPVVITNRHCFESAAVSSEEPGTLDPWACIKTQIFIDFDFQTSTPAERLECVPGSLRTNSSLDLAILRLKTKKKIDFGLNLNPASIAPVERIPSVIVHFPDIAQKRVRTDLKKFPGGPSTMPRIALTYEDCQTAGYFSLEAMNADQSLPYAIRHTCDMLKGSSGSALANLTTGEINGVNWGGIKYGQESDSEAYNLATRSPLVLAFLKMPENELASHLAAIADSPPAEFVGDGTPGTKVERSSKSSTLSAAGCAKITAIPKISDQGSARNDNRNQHGQQSQQNQTSRHAPVKNQLDLSWLSLACFSVARLTGRSFRRSGPRTRLKG